MKASIKDQIQKRKKSGKNNQMFKCLSAWKKKKILFRIKRKKQTKTCVKLFSIHVSVYKTDPLVLNVDAKISNKRKTFSEQIY